MTPPTISFRPKAPAGTVPVTLGRLIESRLLVQANSGGGKSWAVRVLLEETHGQIQQIVLDREGEFATLREHYPYLLVGRDGDVAADVRTAKLLARKLMELGLSAVIDLSEMSLGQQREYVRVFVDAMNHLPRPLWKDCLIVIDEAHLFAPEKGKGSSAASEAIALLLSTGRKRGYCAVLATQRIAKLDKDVAAECLNKMIGRTSQEDLTRAADELGMGKVDAKALRSLDPGTFWAYGPAIAPEPVLVRTDSVQTHPPKRGTAREPAPVAPASIQRAMAELADLPKQAADEARSLDDLQRELRETKAALARAERRTAAPARPVADDTAIARAVEKAVQGERARQQRLLRAFVGALKPLAVKIERINVNVGDIAGIIDGVVTEAEQGWTGVTPDGHTEDSRAAVQVGHTSKTTGANHPSVSAVGQSSRAPARPIATSSSDLPQGERAMLIAIAQQPHGAERDQLSILTGYKRSSRDTYIQRLSAKSFVAIAGSTIHATEDGIAALGDFTPLPTGADLRAYWLERLPEGERKVLQAVLDAYPDGCARDDIDAATGYKRSSRDTYIQRLSARRLVESTGRGSVRASATLFDD